MASWLGPVLGKEHIILVYWCSLFCKTMMASIHLEDPCNASMWSFQFFLKWTRIRRKTGQCWETLLQFEKTSESAGPKHKRIARQDEMKEISKENKSTLRTKGAAELRQDSPNKVKQNIIHQGVNHAEITARSSSKDIQGKPTRETEESLWWQDCLVNTRMIYEQLTKEGGRTIPYVHKELNGKQGTNGSNKTQKTQRQQVKLTQNQTGNTSKSNMESLNHHKLSLGDLWNRPADLFLHSVVLENHKIE